MIDAAGYHVTETLRDGRKVHIRAQRPQDREGYRQAIARASNESLYHRFFVPKHYFSKAEAAYFLDIDFIKHIALVAEVEEEGRPTVVGEGRYVVIEPGRAEVSFALIDEYQGRGIGGMLMRCLAEIGEKMGLREFVAEVLADNSAMLKVFERSGLEMSAARDGSVIDVRLRLPAESADVELTGGT